MKYKPTMDIDNSTNLQSIHPGQWVRLPSGDKGQFLGITKSKAEVILYKREGVSRYQTNWNINLQTLRGFAKAYGAK